MLSLLSIFFRPSVSEPELTTGEVPGTVYGILKKGWIEGKFFDLWFARHFLPHALPTSSNQESRGIGCDFVYTSTTTHIPFNPATS